MLIHKKIGLNTKKDKVISFVGAGGKSTSINLLAKEFKEQGKRVLITTTTKIYYPDHKDNDKFILGEIPMEYKPIEGSISIFGKSMVNGKIKGPSLKELEKIYNRNIFDIILIEGDGAKRKPITAPGLHEPVVPDFTDVTIGIIGLDAIGKPLDEKNSHRPEILREIFKVQIPHIINSKDIIKLIIDENGLFKNAGGKRMVFLNKADNEEFKLIGYEIQQRLLDLGIKNIFITSMKDNIFVN